MAGAVYSSHGYFVFGRVEPPVYLSPKEMNQLSSFLLSTDCCELSAVALSADFDGDFSGSLR